jgi:hypothetical protein
VVEEWRAVKFTEEPERNVRMVPRSGEKWKEIDRWQERETKREREREREKR